MRALSVGIGSTVAAGLVAVAVSLVALGRWGSAEALPPVTLGGACVFGQSASTLTLVADCTPTGSLVIPANKRANGNGKTVDGRNLTDAVIKNAPGSTSNQVYGFHVLADGGVAGIVFTNTGGTIIGNTIDLGGAAFTAGIRIDGGEVIVQNNTVTGLGPSGTGVYATGANTTVTGNRVTGPGSDSASFSAAVRIVSGSATVQGNSAGALDLGFVTSLSPAASVKGNTTRDVREGILVIGSFGGNANGVVVSGNDIEASATGVRVYSCFGSSANNVTVTRNNIVFRPTPQAGGPVGVGIYFHSTTGIFGSCSPVPGTIDGGAITWNTLVGWAPAPDVLPIALLNAANITQKYNRMVP